MSAKHNVRFMFYFCPLERGRRHLMELNWCNPALDRKWLTLTPGNISYWEYIISHSLSLTSYDLFKYSTLILPYFQDDNLSLSLLNELSVKYGIQTHLSHAPLPQKLEELREYIRREIKKELKVRILILTYLTNSTEHFCFRIIQDFVILHRFTYFHFPFWPLAL